MTISQDEYFDHIGGMKERLARIETSQNQTSEQLGKLVNLFDRMVRVEELHKSANDKIAEARENAEQIKNDLNEVKREIAAFKTAHGVLAWIAGIASSVIAGAAVWMFKK